MNNEWKNKETHQAIIDLFTPKTINSLRDCNDSNDVKALLLEIGQYNDEIDCNDIFDTLNEVVL